MRWLIYVTLGLAMAWSGYWMVERRATLGALDKVVEDRRADGWTVAYSDLSVRGFPNRLDATASDVDLRLPGGDWAWSAPFLQILRLSYTRGHLILNWPTRQTLTAFGQPVDVTSARMQASVQILPGGEGRVDRVVGVAEDMTLDGPDWTLAAAQVLLAARQSGTGPGPAAYDIGFETTGAQLGLTVPDPGVDLPRDPARLNLQTVWRFDTPWGPGFDAPDLRGIDIQSLEFQWGQIALSGAGQVQVEPGGLTGTIDLTLRNWRDALTILRATGWDAPGLEQALMELAAQKDTNDPLTVPLSISGNKVRLAGIDLN